MELIGDLHEVVVSFNDGVYFTLYSLDSFIVDSSTAVLSIFIQPSTLNFQKIYDTWNLFRFRILFMRGLQLLLPRVRHRLQLIFLFVGLENQSVLIKHCCFCTEKGFDVFGFECVESYGIVFNFGESLFLDFFYLELLFYIHLFCFNWGAFTFLCLFFLIFFLIFLLLFFLLFLWNF